MINRAMILTTLVLMAGSTPLMSQLPAEERFQIYSSVLEYYQMRAYVEAKKPGYPSELPARRIFQLGDPNFPFPDHHSLLSESELHQLAVALSERGIKAEICQRRCSQGMNRVRVAFQDPVLIAEGKAEVLVYTAGQDPPRFGGGNWMASALYTLEQSEDGWLVVEKTLRMIS